jgi:hypothetical protein
MAIEAGIRPTSLILHTQPRKKWNEHDFLLLKAYKILQDERCSQCGLPRWICHNESSDIQIAVRDDLCYAKKEIEAKANPKAKAGEKKRFGKTAYPSPYTISGKPLDWHFRDQHYAAS